MAVDPLGVVPALQGVEWFDIFVLSYSIVHILFEYNLWVRRGSPFTKYASGRTWEEEARAGRLVYFTKAKWMICMVVAQYLGYSFRTALTVTFAIYSVELLILFPPRLYAVLNVLLAFACVVELVYG